MLDRVLGMQSGTSHDGIDMAVVEFTGRGDELLADVVWYDEVEYSPALRRMILQALPPGQVSAEELCRIDVGVGEEFARAAAHAQHVSGGFDAVCSHGQTMFHGVDDTRVWGTLQVGQAAWIAEACGVPVVSDVRIRDVAAGGQGAPLVAVLDMKLGARLHGSSAFVNLGGIANVTLVQPGTGVLAFDIGPANALIDAAMSSHPNTPAPFDRGGAAARRGRVNQAVLARLLDEPYYKRASPKTTGKELFNADYLHRNATGTDGDDLVATLTELTAQVVSHAIISLSPDHVFLSGGGVRNTTLMARIAHLVAPRPVQPTDALGVPSDAKEAVAFALIGWMTLHGLPASIPSVTGARGSRILGSITPGDRHLNLGSINCSPTSIVVRASSR